MSRPRREPWENTLDLATRRFERDNGVMLDMETRNEFAALLTAGCQRASAEARDGDYEQAGEDFIGRIAQALERRGYRRNETWETRGTPEPKAALSVLPAGELREAVASLCPGFWPFC